MKSQYLTTDDTANFLHCSVATLQAWRKAGTGPPWLKVGRRVLYSEKSLELWIKKKAGVR